MNPRLLAESSELAARVGHVFLSTSGPSGKPHLAAARTMSVTPENRLVVADWFCPETLNNLQVNPYLSIVVWEAGSDQGFQLLGELEEMRDLAMMNGYSPELEKEKPIPQVDRELIVRVDKIIDFKIAPHSDVEA